MKLTTILFAAVLLAPTISYAQSDIEADIASVQMDEAFKLLDAIQTATTHLGHNGQAMNSISICMDNMQRTINKDLTEIQPICIDRWANELIKGYADDYDLGVKTGERLRTMIQFSFRASKIFGDMPIKVMFDKYNIKYLDDFIGTGNPYAID